MKIYKIYANYEDYDSSSLITIGVFSDYDKAISVKKKWIEFHNMISFPVMPNDWNPKEDNWYSEEYDFSWEDSSEYQREISKAGILKNFTEIKIDEYDLDEDRFSKNGHWDEQKKSIIESFDRDYKIKSILFDDGFE